MLVTPLSTFALDIAGDLWASCASMPPSRFSIAVATNGLGLYDPVRRTGGRHLSGHRREI